MSTDEIIAYKNLLSVYQLTLIDIARRLESIRAFAETNDQRVVAGDLKRLLNEPVLRSISKINGGQADA